MYFELANLLVFTVVAIGFVILNLVIAKLLRPKLRPHGDKLEIYECGEPTVGQAWIRFDIRFYTVALMFVVFDVEIALLFPWGVIFRDLVERGLGMLAFIEAGTFIAILMVGLAYVWSRGDIDWTPKPENEIAEDGGSDFDRRAAVMIPDGITDGPDGLTDGIAAISDEIQAEVDAAGVAVGDETGESGV